MAEVDDEELLLAVLNSSPVVDGRPTDLLHGPEAAKLSRTLGGCGSEQEHARLRQVRDTLQRLIREDSTETDGLLPALERVSLRPSVSVTGVAWELAAPPDDELAARVVLAWSHVITELPGRLRACANEECNLYLVDHSRPGTARWCSMAVCGNRMKARTHARRRRVEK